MNFELTEQQQKLQDLAIRFARQCLDDDMTQRDREEHFSRIAWKQCADFGLLNTVVPEEYGGSGLGLADFIAVMEGLGYGGRDQGLLFSLNAHLWTNTIPLLRYGTDEQKRK